MDQDAPQTSSSSIIFNCCEGMLIALREGQGMNFSHYGQASAHLATSSRGLFGHWDVLMSLSLFVDSLKSSLGNRSTWVHGHFEDFPFSYKYIHQASRNL